MLIITYLKTILIKAGETTSGGCKSDLIIAIHCNISKATSVLATSWSICRYISVKQLKYSKACVAA